MNTTPLELMLRRPVLTRLLVVFFFAGGLVACGPTETAESEKAASESQGTKQQTASAADTTDEAPAPLTLVEASAPVAPDRADAFAAAAAAAVGESFSSRGADPAWFFTRSELKQLELGAFWDKPWEETAVNKTDPVPFAVEFAELLEARGIELILMPVPPKGSIYPDKLDADFEPGEPYLLAPFYERLRQEGVDVIDVEPAFRAYREAHPDAKLYCEQDAHYSPLACRLLADLLRTEIAERAWFEELDTDESLVRGPVETLEITGDQVLGSEWEGEAGTETLEVRYAGRAGADGTIEPVEADPASPVLLLGDSHTLVFQEGASNGMHSRGAGLLDQLQVALGIPLAHVGTRGSGMVQARKDLYQLASRTPGFWDSKKLVIWVFTAREFTQSSDQLRAIPLERS